MIDLRVENLDDAIRGQIVCVCDPGCVHICRAVCHGDSNVLSKEGLECALVLQARGVCYRAIDDSVLKNALECFI
jgi:hypothetical protein